MPSRCRSADDRRGRRRLAERPPRHRCADTPRRTRPSVLDRPVCGAAAAGCRGDHGGRDRSARLALHRGRTHRRVRIRAARPLTHRSHGGSGSDHRRCDGVLGFLAAGITTAAVTDDPTRPFPDGLAALAAAAAALGDRRLGRRSHILAVTAARGRTRRVCATRRAAADAAVGPRGLPDDPEAW